MTDEFAEKLDSILNMASNGKLIGCGMLGMTDIECDLNQSCEYIYRNSDYFDKISTCYRLNASGFDALRDHPETR